MEEETEVDLCLICCSKVNNDHDIRKNIINGSLLSRNLNVFYLVRQVLKLNDNELKKNLIGCGNPVEWIRLCDKCDELTGQAEKLNSKLKKIERELNCVEKLILDKTVKSINCEVDRKLVKEEGTIDFENNDRNKVWRRIRNYVAVKSSNIIRTDIWTNPFIEGDKLANYLVTQKGSGAILLVEGENNEEEKEDDDLDNGNVDVALPSPCKSKIKIEVDNEEEEVGGDWNWEADEDDNKNEEDDSESEVDQDQEKILKCSEKDKEVDSEEKSPEKKKMRRSKVMGPPRRQLKITNLEKDNICDQCGKGYKIREQLRKHVKHVHDKNFNFKCNLCGAGWISGNPLRKHMLAMHPEDPLTKKLVEEEGLGLWRCPVNGCSVTFLKEISLKGHLKSKHGQDDKQVEGMYLASGSDSNAGAVALDDPNLKATCLTCGKCFINKQGLNRHEKLVHQNEGKAKDFICEVCGKGFVDKGYLGHHVRLVHLKIGKPKGKDFKCEICGKEYEYKYKLKEHLKMHEGKRDYFCDKCGHGFVTGKNLSKHKRVTGCGREGQVSRGYNRKM